MKKAIYATVVVALLAFFAGSLAQDLPRIFSGRIQTIDGGSRTIAVMRGENQMIFQVAENTMIKTDYGEKIAFTELQVTMSVAVEYMKEGDDIRPLSIKVSTMPKGFGAHTASGTIGAKDVAGETITVTDQGKNTVIHITGNTSITDASGHNVPIADVQIGMPVAARYTIKQGLNQGLTVNVGATPKGPGKKQTKKTSGKK